MFLDLLSISSYFPNLNFNVNLSAHLSLNFFLTKIFYVQWFTNIHRAYKYLIKQIKIANKQTIFIFTYFIFLLSAFGTASDALLPTVLFRFLHYFCSRLLIRLNLCQKQAKECNRKNGKQLAILPLFAFLKWSIDSPNFSLQNYPS